MLFYACIPLFIVYLFLFRQTFRLLDQSERKRLVTEAARPRWRPALTAVFVLLLIFLGDPLWRAAVGAVWIADTAWASVNHHRRLRALGFDPVFRQALAGVSYLSGVVMLFFVAGMVLTAR
jgi:hypothetical protein